MPPQQTNITPETERDAAGLGLDLPIALAKGAMDEALAAAAAGPTATSTRTVPGLLKRYWRAFRERLQRHSLRDLSDWELMDIGLTRDEVDYITPQGAIDRSRDSTTYLWSRGVM